MLARTIISSAARRAVSRQTSVARPVVARAAPISLGSRSAIAFRGYASGPESVSPLDPQLVHAQTLLNEGTSALEQGDFQKAKDLYEQSISSKSTSGAWFNLGVVEYQLGSTKGAIEAWQQSIKLEPSADAYTNLGSAYMMSKPPQPAEAIKALTAAMELSPNDPEIQFNLAAILESTGKLETALTLYKRALEGGIERAQVNIRNIGAKILAQRVQEAKDGATKE